MIQQALYEPPESFTVTVTTSTPLRGGQSVIPSIWCMCPSRHCSLVAARDRWCLALLEFILDLLHIFYLLFWMFLWGFLHSNKMPYLKLYSLSYTRSYFGKSLFNMNWKSGKKCCLSNSCKHQMSLDVIIMSFTCWPCFFLQHWKVFKPLL